jgi:hypothetical protein
MFFVHFLFALLIALLLTALFMAGFRLRSPWGLLWFFVIILLASWAGGVWFTPFGPASWATGWLPFLLVGLIAALLIAAATLPEREESTVELVDTERRRAERKAAKRALGIFFWVLVVLLAGIIAIRYI